MQTNASGSSPSGGGSSSSAATVDGSTVSTSGYVADMSNFVAPVTTDLRQWSGAGRKGERMKRQPSNWVAVLVAGVTTLLALPIIAVVLVPMIVAVAIKAVAVGAFHASKEG